MKSRREIVGLTVFFLEFPLHGVVSTLFLLNLGPSDPFTHLSPKFSLKCANKCVPTRGIEASQEERRDDKHRCAPFQTPIPWGVPCTPALNEILNNYGNDPAASG